MFKSAKVYKTKNESEIGLSFNQINIPIILDELGIELDISLYKENVNSLWDIFNTKLIVECEKFLQHTDINVVQNGEVKPLNKFSLALLATEFVFWAFQTATDEWKPTLKVDIISPKEWLDKFKRENKEYIRELQKLKKWLSSRKEEKRITLEDVINKIDTLISKKEIVYKSEEVKQQQVVVWKKEESYEQTKTGKRMDLSF